VAAGVQVVALDLTDTYRSGLSPHLAHATRVADPFHVTRVANRMVDQVRRRVQNETLGHRAGKPIHCSGSASSSSREKNASTIPAGTSSWPRSGSATLR